MAHIIYESMHIDNFTKVKKKITIYFFFFLQSFTEDDAICVAIRNAFILHIYKNCEYVTDGIQTCK